ncbi:MAG TPA: SGNH/GDSL hydrolase family protein [Ktedonobacterales bacterium]|nr:SGNH/GDSL hydrolase family protein [Ktedonobacterales bacterium]
MRQPSRGAGTARGTTRTGVLPLVGLSILLVLALAGIDVLVLSHNNPARAFGPHYYMALGDSLTFGYQPNLDFSAGFADDLFNTLKPSGVTEAINYGCAGETTTTFIQGGCVARFLHHGSYTGAQLGAALAFLKNPRNVGRVSPITLEIGSNDVIPDWDENACTAGPNTDADLATMDNNLTHTILPELTQALALPKGARVGDLHLLNYYNPFAKQCPTSAPFIHRLNDHLAADAAKFRVPVVDVYNAFGGDMGAAGNVCTLTWICSSSHDVHPMNAGYTQIARAVKLTLGLPGGAALPGIVPVNDAAPVLEAWQRRDDLA